MAWQLTVGTIGGLAAVVGQFFGGPGMSPNLFLPLIGGVLALLALWVK